MKEALFFGPTNKDFDDKWGYLPSEDVIGMKTMVSKVDNLIKQNNNLTAQKSTISNLNAKVDSMITYNNSLGEVNIVLITKMDKLLERKGK